MVEAVSILRIRRPACCLSGVFEFSGIVSQSSPNEVRNSPRTSPPTSGRRLRHPLIRRRTDVRPSGCASAPGRPLRPERATSQQLQQHLMNVTTVITVRGTTKSERAGGLDDGEVSQFTIGPGQYDPRVTTPNDLIEQINRSAYLRGEWIASLRIGQVDVVQDSIAEALRESQGDVDDVVQALSEVGMFCNADADDLRPLVTLAANEQRAE